jgi:glucose/mannose-6-phosphate isomerase
MKILDDQETFRRLDPNEIFKAITDFPINARKALQYTQNIIINLHEEDYDSILIVGMGGSAVGGLLLRDWLLDYLKIPISVNRGYNLPAWVDNKTLIYAVSYSGNTEETLSQYKAALERNCTIICFCSGGQLKNKAEENNHILVNFPTGYQPRAAIPFQFYSLAGVSRKIGFIKDKKWEEVSESIKVVETICARMKPEVPYESNFGKKFAQELKGYIPLIYAPQLFTNVAYRYSTQFNENSKVPSGTNFFPESFHNSVMAREGHVELLAKICIVIIRDSRINQELSRKIDTYHELMQKTFGKSITVETRGDSNLARIMSALIQGDYASAYLAILYEVDPSTTESIKILKASMRA